MCIFACLYCDLSLCIYSWSSGSSCAVWCHINGCSWILGNSSYKIVCYWLIYTVFDTLLICVPLDASVTLSALSIVEHPQCLKWSTTDAWLKHCYTYMAPINCEHNNQKLLQFIEILESLRNFWSTATEAEIANTIKSTLIMLTCFNNTALNCHSNAYKSFSYADSFDKGECIV